MTERAFDTIRAGLEDAIAFAKGDTTRCTVHYPKRKPTPTPPDGEPELEPSQP